MMHDMHDLQCLNASITPGCYKAGPSKRCSRALDRTNESTLMVISSSSSGTLVLVPDIPLTYFVAPSVCAGMIEFCLWNNW